MASQKSRDDLSTEQILESIGRIVSESESRGATPDDQAANAPAAAEDEDVLDLVEMVDEQGNAIPPERANEEQVAETLRPMLERWLDTHEPQVVERLIRREIERATRRSGPE